VLALREEWMDEEDEQYRVPGGNDQMIYYLEKECREANGVIHTSTIVTSINWKRNEVSVVAQNGKKYDGNKVIVAVPLGVLQAEPAMINFQPLIDDYVDASKKIGFGSVIKVLLQFKECFWEEKRKNIGKPWPILMMKWLGWDSPLCSRDMLRRPLTLFPIIFVE